MNVKGTVDRKDEKAERHVESQKPTAETADRWARKLLDMYTLEQVDQLLEIMQVTYDNAVIRETEQSFTILFNDKGFPRAFNGSNNVRPMKPKQITYKPE